MNPVEELIKEHEEVERELLELEEITNAKVVNYPNLIHVLTKINLMWDKHENKEDEVFPILEKKGFDIPIEKILCDHKDLNIHFKIISKAINSGNESETKQALLYNGKKIIKKLREHKDFEDEILFTLPKSLIEGLEC
jgi:iron-sulfur cluster repair protein YtfE (RIC family)